MIVFLRHIFAATVVLLLVSHLVFAQVIDASEKQTETGSSNGVVPHPDKGKFIHFGDLIEVDVVGSTEFDWRGQVTPEGFLGGLAFTEEPVYALCKSTSEVAAKIQNDFSRFLNQPVVHVEILDKSNRPLVVMFGAVKQPQRFRLMRPVMLRELIVLAGGFSDRASGVIEVIRRPDSSCTLHVEEKKGSIIEVGNVAPKNEAQYIRINISELLSGGINSNPVVNYGDLITVESSKPIYVIGSVANPGNVPFSKGLTVSRAIAAAGGALGKAGKSEMRLFRRNPGGTEIIEVASGGGKSADPDTFELKEYDIVEVFGSGESSLKYPPVLKNTDFEDRTAGDLPVRIVD